MPHLDYRERPFGDRPLNIEADYVVVGTGAGGAAAASTLARTGATVAMVEAGPWRAPEDYPESMYGTLRDMMDGWGVTMTRGRAFWPIVQASVVGGTTVINSAIVVRTPGDVFRDWQRDFGVGGDDLAHRVWAHQDIIEGELSVQPVPESAYGRPNTLARTAAQALGIHDHDMRRNVAGCVGSGQCMQGCRGGHKRSVNLNYIPEVLSLGGSLLSCAPASRVLMRSKTAVGVTGRFKDPATGRRGQRFFVRARKGVLIAASATRSPLLLMSSFHPLLRRGHKALGDGFRAHPGTGLFGVYDSPVNMNQGATQGWASTKFRDQGFKLETLSLPLELVASRLSGAGSQLIQRIEEFPFMTMWVMGVRAKAVGTVRRGLFGEPVVHYALSDDDMRIFRRGAHTIARMHFEAGAKKVVPGIHGMPYVIGPDEVDTLLNVSLDPRHFTGILSHLFGGCVMGTDPRTSVCDGSGRVHGTENLVVVDASVLPGTLGVNPQHTIMGVARTFAEDLALGRVADKAA